MDDFDWIVWDDEDDPRGNVRHIALNGVSPEQWEDAFGSPGEWTRSRSTNLPGKYGHTREGTSSSCTAS